MSIIRCKVRVYSVFDRHDSTTDQVIQQTIHIGGVYSDDPESENRRWAKATPAFNLSMVIDNPEAFDKLEQNKEYFLDFTPALIPPAE